MNHLKLVIPKTLHFVLNTECNAWDLKSMAGSPGVCRFCYRATEKVATSQEKIAQLMRLVREESEICRIVFTGGDPLMPKDNHIEFAVQQAKELEFVVNIHTNGLLLAAKYPTIGQWIDVFTLAIDGASADTANWERGEGYFERFLDNMQLLIREGKTVAFNTFVSPHNFRDLENIAKMISSFAMKTQVEYWLISQYRPIARDSAKKRELYCFSDEQFKAAVEKIVQMYPDLNVYSQPTRQDDLYPLRIWLLADGVLTMDTGKSSLNRNVVVGNCLESGFMNLYNHALRMREQSTGQ